MRWFLVPLALLWLALPALAEPPDRQCTSAKWGSQHCIRDAHFVYDTCQLLKHASERHGLPTGFFTRLIWQESRFDPNALSHANAMGIAQFIRSTANIRGLENPYNPADALMHSAHYLGEMSRRYGNPGLAAIGYNGGERRVEGFMAKTGGLARETTNYVRIITGSKAEVWRDSPPKSHDYRLSKTEPFLPACYTLAEKRKLSPLAAIKPSPPALQPWGVRLAYGKSQKATRAAAKRLTRSCSNVIGKARIDILPVKTRLRNGRKYYEASVGRASRKSAVALCIKMTARNCNCRVIER